jgi:hypothetical protein
MHFSSLLCILHALPISSFLVHSPSTFNGLAHGKEFLAPCTTPQFEDHPLMIISDSIFSIFTATLEAIFSTGNQKTHHAMVTRDHLNVEYYILGFEN